MSNLSEKEIHRLTGGAVLAAALALFLGIAALPLIDRDEPRFSRATLEMMERGDWVIPWFNGEYRFDKPPLTYWMMRAGYLVLGRGEAGARLHSVLAALGTAALLWWWLGRRGHALAGRLAALVWLTVMQVQLHGRLAVADMPMIFFITLSQIAIFELLHPAGPPQPKVWRLVLAASLGLGFLAKGPLAYLVPLIGLAFYRWLFWRQPLAWASLHPLRTLGLSLLPIIAWGVPALILTGGSYWEVGMEEHVIDRGFDSFNSRSIIPGYYFLTIFLSFLPWWSWAGAAAREGEIRWRRDPLHAFLAAWACAPFLIFLFYKTQLPHYTLPAFPALAALLGWALKSGKMERTFSRRFFWGLQGLWWLLLGGLAVFFFVPAWPEPRLPLRHLFAWLLACLALLSLLPVLWKIRRPLTLRLMVPVILLAGVAFYAGSHALGKISPARQIASLLQALPAEPVLVATGFTEPSLVFYSGRPWLISPSMETLQSTWEHSPSVLAVTLRKEIPFFEWLVSAWTGNEEPTSKLPDGALEAIRHGVPPGNRTLIEGFNTARMSWSVIEVWTRDGAVAPPANTLPPPPAHSRQ